MQTIEHKLRGVIITQEPESVVGLRIMEAIGWLASMPRLKQVAQGKKVMIMADYLSAKYGYDIEGRQYPQSDRAKGLHYY